MIAVLHNVRSSHNVGSIFRTADAAGISALYLCGITPGPKDRFGRENRNLTKVALRAETYVPWSHERSTPRLLDRLRKDGYAIVCVEQSAKARSLYDLPRGWSRTQRTALVVGDEIRGLPPSVLDRADLIVEIPMRGKKESLNVAVAFGIAAYALK